MKLTNNVIELMFELSSIEGVKNAHYLNGEGVDLRNNLLKLFNDTSNPAAQDIIINIMDEAGYDWFGEIARSEEVFKSNSVSTSERFYESSNELMTEDEFMDLIPANGRIH